MDNARPTFAGDLFAFLRPFVEGAFFLLPLPFFPFFGAIWLNEDPQEHTERNLDKHTQTASFCPSWSCTKTREAAQRRGAGDVLRRRRCRGPKGLPSQIGRLSRQSSEIEELSRGRQRVCGETKRRCERTEEWVVDPRRENVKAL